ncbi:sugar-binding protein [Ulvibacterium marinum]|uniref:sugar-binding protein n=1 Tax=Ulvibacterium marinum TaxID=2419782 RepID=UPI002493E858|nr:sugar-binding protein [Ulvibacterium marinum]
MKAAMTLCLAFLCMCCNTTKKKEDHHIISVKKSPHPIAIDGKATENIWAHANWHALDQNWLGGSYEHDDFNGHYKLSWDEDALYVLVEITDDVLFDQYKDPLKLWWNDDCVEVFIDEDNSGGLHQFSHNAFAYHIALDGNVVDLAPNKEPQLYNEHIVSKHTTEGQTTTWEIAIYVYDDTYVDGGNNIPKTLNSAKKIGFALAYCDNDSSTERENFIGSVFVPGEDKNQGWINADIFGTLLLEE